MRDKVKHSEAMDDANAVEIPAFISLNAHGDVERDTEKGEIVGGKH